MISDYLLDPRSKPKHKVKKTPQKKVYRKYSKVCPEFIAEFKKDLEDGWSIGYACRNIPNEVTTLKRSFSQFPELKKIYDDYILSKNLKKFYKYPKL